MNFAGAGNLTMNGGSTFVLQASGNAVNTVQDVATFSYDASNGTVNLAVLPLDNTTLNGVNTYTFLTYTTGPTTGVQSNWNITSRTPSPGPAPATWLIGTTSPTGAA